MGQPDGAGCVAAAAPDELCAAAQRAQHAVIATRDDGAVMVEDGVGNAGQAAARLQAVAHDRLAAGVGAGHHEQQVLRRCQPLDTRRARGGFVEQEKVNGRCRQHDAEFHQARRNAGQQGLASGVGAQQNDRALAALQQFAFGV